MTEKVRWRISPDAIQAESWLDILPAVGEDPRALGYDGSQPPCSLGAKRPRFDRTSRRVAVPTMTHILPKRILSYLSANIHRTRLVAPHDSQTHRPRSTRFPSRFRPQHEHVLLAFLFNEDAVFLGFGLESRGEAVELPFVGLVIPAHPPRVLSNIAHPMRPTSRSIHCWISPRSRLVASRPL